jgi:hypothetical protein
MLWIYDIPTWLFGLLTVATTTGASLAGLLLTYRLIHKRLPAWNTLVDNEVVGAFLSQILTLYGITLGLIAVATWESATQVSDYASNEAAVITALYRDLNGYPSPIKDDLRGRLRDYTRAIVEVEWPAQKQNRIIDDATRMLSMFQDRMMAFEPQTKGQEIVHAEAFNALNRMIEARRRRVEAVGTSIPGVLWAVVFLGGAIAVFCSYFFQIHDLKVHALMTAGLGATIGLLVFLIASMDHPYLGEVSVPADAYKLILERVMPLAQVR